MTNLSPKGNQLFTIADLLERGFSINKPIILQDPDTDWLMAPSYLEDKDHITIMSDYDKSRRHD